jgi:hypothetical protein
MTKTFMNLSDNTYEDNKKTKSYRHIIVVVIVLCISFVIGLLIGHFGIEKDTNSSKEGTSSGDGVFLSGVPEAIVRDADPTVSDWILKELNADRIRENLRFVCFELKRKQQQYVARRSHLYCIWLC